MQIAPILRYIDSMRYGILSRYYGSLERKAEAAGNLEARERARRERGRYQTQSCNSIQL
jgi:hypothetical protein